MSKTTTWQVSHIIPDESQGDAGDMNESEIYDRLIEHI
ncbi:hypothetical protein [Vibrio phage J14]|nr:hypothetical protein [Vibrio phage J14]